MTLNGKAIKVEEGISAARTPQGKDIFHDLHPHLIWWQQFELIVFARYFRMTHLAFKAIFYVQMEQNAAFEFSEQVGEGQN